MRGRELRHTELFAVALDDESSLNNELCLLNSPGMKCMARRPLNSNAFSSLVAGLGSDCFRATDNI